MDEFRLIERFFCRDSKSSSVVVGIGDDGAVVNTGLEMVALAIIAVAEDAL